MGRSPKKMHWPRDVVRGAPSWERIAYRGFGGAYSTFELRIRLKREVDWSRLVARVGKRYREEGPTSTVLGARQNWMPAERFVVPGSYLLYAVVPAFAVVGYPPKLGKYSRYPIFDSASLTVSGRPGEVIRLRVGLPSSKRALDPAHLAFLEQWNKEEIVPPPPPMRAVELEQLVEEDAREA